ncbi:MAG TPA: SRPBCC family protein [Saprospiraceae bacterium]|nr:SRPBCC family protein [Saprospiraceae bacterium]
MKILKYLLYVLLALVVIGVILGLVGPKTYQLERSVVIDSTPDMVWPHISSLRKVNEWSPFLKMDSTAVVEYTGNDGEVGSSSSWSGNKNVGKGTQTIVSQDPMKSSVVKLTFFTPFGTMDSEGYLNLDSDPAGTKVTWGMRGENGFVGRIMSFMMSMEKAVGPSFESGLADLKAMVEAEPKAPKMDMNYPISSGDFAGGKYLAIHKTIPMSEISDFFMKSVPTLIDALKKGKVEMAGVPTGIYYTWDEKKGESDMAVGVPMKSDMKAPAGMEVIVVPAHKAMILDYKGGYSKMGDAHMAMDAHLKGNKMESMAPVVEEYYVGPAMEKDSMKWMTKIIYLVK